jgi:transitional endoplasmic reticulum ATPase
LGLECGSGIPGALSNLTPGDFAAVVRQARFRPIASALEWYGRLKAECEIKPSGQRQAIGFAA